MSRAMSCEVYKKAKEKSECGESYALCLGVCAKHHIKEFFKAQDANFLATGVHKHVMGEVEKALLEVVLELADGNKLKSSKILGLNRNTLRKKIAEHNIDEGSFGG
jgi:DNA-binding protein Fis